MTKNGKVWSNQLILKCYCLNNLDLAFLPRNIISINFGVMYSRHIKSLIKTTTKNSEQLVAQRVFWNDNILVGNRTLSQRSWTDNGISYIKIFWSKTVHFYHLTVLKRNPFLNKNIKLKQITLHTSDMYKLSKVIYVR